MHFLKKEQFNMKVFIQLRKITKQLKKIIQVLNIWLDFQFRWNCHLNKITNKMKNQVNMLIRTMSFMWDFSLLQTCQVYTAVIQSALIYRMIMWHQLQILLTQRSIKDSITNRLIRQQNKCLQIITEIYKIILLITIKTEMFISSLNLHLNSIVFQTVKKLEHNRMTC